MGLTPEKTATSGIFFYWDSKVHNFFSNVQFFITKLLNFVTTKWKIWSYIRFRLNTDQQQQLQQNNQQFCVDQNSNLCSGEIKMVMNRLGILCDPDGDEFGEAEFSALFEAEPHLEEIKEAFDVFDHNKDGFLDPTELHRVFCSLDPKEESNVEDCRRMISGFDENGDGLLDFNEFSKLMEKSFC